MVPADIKAKVITKEKLVDILARGHAVSGPVGNSLLANGETNHGRNLVKLKVCRLNAGNSLLHAHVNVVGSQVAHVHGTTATLDTRPLDKVTNGEMVIGVGGFGGEVEAATSNPLVLFLNIRQSWSGDIPGLDLDITLLIEDFAGKEGGRWYTPGDGHND